MDEKLYEPIGREPADARKLASPMMATAWQTTADILGASGGVSGVWGNLQRVLLSNFMSLAAFATAMQLGVAIGVGEYEELILPVVDQKYTDEQFIREMLLETAPLAILYDQPLSVHMSLICGVSGRRARHTISMPNGRPGLDEALAVDIDRFCTKTDTVERCFENS